MSHLKLSDLPVEVRNRILNENHMKPRNPLEHEHQVSVFEWAEANQEKYPFLEYMFAIPNGGGRPAKMVKGNDGKWTRFSREGFKMKKEGQKAGVPDIFLPYPKDGWHGLFIEMKRHGGRIRPDQKRWIEYLKQNYFTAVCWNAFEAIHTIQLYAGIATV